MLLVSSKHVFIEKEAAWLCATMLKRSSTAAGLMWHI